MIDPPMTSDATSMLIEMWFIFLAKRVCHWLPGR